VTWIRTVAEDDAEGLLAEVYAQAREEFSFVPDAVKVFSLRPHVAAAQARLRRTLLGNASTLGARRADLIGAAVSGLNRCEYCGTAHAGLLAKRADLGEDEAVGLFRNWRSLDLPEDERAMLTFAEKLTLMPSEVTEADIERLRAVGFSEENIYDIVMLTAYRNFMNRVNDGLGVPTDRLRKRFGDSLVDAVARGG
jgi:uncharacterized peroxidase-related enzyme